MEGSSFTGMNDAGANQTRDEMSEANLFADLTEAQRTTLFNNARKQFYPKNALIFAPGDQSSVVYYVVAGFVKIYDLTGDGREIIYRMCGANSWFGMSAVFGGKVRPVFAQTQAPTEVLGVDLASFERFIQDNPGFSVAVIHLLGQRLRQAHNAITEFVIGDVRSRIAQIILKFAEAGSSTRGGVVTIENRFTHQEIANMIGATRTTVTKVINEWKRREIVHVARGRIQIRNFEELARLIRH